MNQENNKSALQQPDPQRMKILRSLPLHIKQSLTKEEVDAFLYEETWPVALAEKLQDFLYDA